MMTPRTDWHRYLEQNVFKQVHPLVAEIELRAKQNLPTDLDMYTGELPLDLIPSFDFPALNWKQFLKEEAQDELGYLPLRKKSKPLQQRNISFIYQVKVYCLLQVRNKHF